MQTERTYLENKLKTLETSTNFADNPEYTETNEKLDKIYLEKTNGIRIRSNVIGTSREKNVQNFFLNLEKSLAFQNQIRNINNQRI